MYCGFHLQHGILYKSQLKTKLATKEEECNKLTKINEQYNVHYNKKKEIIAKLQEELKSKTQAVENARAIEEKYANQMAPMRDQLNLELAKNKTLGMFH